jgi:hypothetical protein
MTMGKGGQTANVSFTGVVSVQKSRRSRRRGDSRTMVRHFRHTCTSVCHACIEQVSPSLLLLLEPDSHSNRIFLRGQRRGACRLSPGLHRTSQQQLQCCAKDIRTSASISRFLPSPHDVHTFLSTSLPNGNLSGWMTQGGKEMMAGLGQW